MICISTVATNLQVKLPKYTIQRALFQNVNIIDQLGRHPGCCLLKDHWVQWENASKILAKLCEKCIFTHKKRTIILKHPCESVICICMRRTKNVMCLVIVWILFSTFICRVHQNMNTLMFFSTVLYSTYTLSTFLTDFPEHILLYSFSVSSLKQYSKHTVKIWLEKFGNDFSFGMS